MHDCIKYRLNPNGTVPSFLCLHPEGVGGAFGVASPGTTQHDDTVFIGLQEPGTSGNFEVVPTQADLEAYLAVIGANWTEPVDPNDLDGPTKPFDPVAAAQWVWDRKTALDAGS
jgi:hypothetical protein